MNLTGEDCFFYLNSYCVKGRSCPFRHEPLAREADTVCLYWEQGRCNRLHCMFRHSRLDGSQIQSVDVVEDTEDQTGEEPNAVSEDQNQQEEPVPEPMMTSPVPTPMPHFNPASTNKIIVNKKKLADLGLPIEAFLPALSKEIQKHRNLKDRIGIKSRLGYSTPSSRLLERLGQLPQKDTDIDSEEERLRTMAIKSIDLRSRIKAKPKTEDDELNDSDNDGIHVRKVILPNLKSFQDDSKISESESAPSLAMRIAMKRDNLYSDLKREDELHDKGISHRRSHEDRMPRSRRSRTPDSYRRRRSDRGESWRRQRRSSERRRRRSRSRSRNRSRSPRRHRTEVPTVMSKISIVNSDSNQSKGSESPRDVTNSSEPKEPEHPDHMIESNDQKETLPQE